MSQDAENTGTTPERASKLDALFEDPVLLSRIQAESAFGLREVEGFVQSLPAESVVLEVGCGTAYLLAQLASKYPDIEFHGLEPIGSGFQTFAETLSAVEASSENLTIHRNGIEGFDAPDGWDNADLIFAVNVFEHLEDWREGFRSTVKLLKPDGVAVILCPNYAIPYEPHFSIPLVGGPRISRKVFSRRIEGIEANHDAHGLWDSINFISVPQLKTFAREEGFRVTFDREIMARMLDRLGTDAEFAKRQSRVAWFAQQFHKFGGGRLLSMLPAAASPYMKAIVTRD